MKEKCKVRYAVDKDGTEHRFIEGFREVDKKVIGIPYRNLDYCVWQTNGIEHTLEPGTICKEIGREISWLDEPVETWW